MQLPQRPTLRCIAGLLLLGAETLQAREFYFSPSSLEGGGSSQAADLAIFSNPKAQLAGSYPTRILVNERKIQERTLSYINADDGSLVPLLTPLMLRDWGVKVDDYPELANAPADIPLKKALGEFIPAAAVTFDFNKQSLHLSIPQIAVQTVSKGYVNPASWDAGVPVIFTDYAFSTQEDENHFKNQYLNLRSGANVGGWRLRNYSTWTNSSGNKSWQNIGTWLQHDIHALKAQFVAGQSSTRGEVFDSLQYSGMNIASDDEMLPASERGFAPVINGVANSNATVTVEQNGYLIYQQNVAPGAFEIRDLYPPTNSGDLTITVKEADGSEHISTQATSSVALMQRPSHWRFESTLGYYRADNNSKDKEPLFFQSSAIYGLTNSVTVFGGVTAAENYSAVAAGVGMSFGKWGAISTDVTAARAELDNSTSSDGQSWRVLYSSDIAATQTHFTLASYRYSTKGFYSFADANQPQDETSAYNNHKRSRMQVSISQPLGDGSLYLNGYQQNYWESSRTERNLSAGFNYTLMDINYHLALTLNDANDSNDRMVSFGFSVPLNRWLPNTWANYSLSNSKNGTTTQNLGLNGSLLEDNSLNYSLQQSHSNQDPASSSSVYGTWYARSGRLNAGYYSATDGSRQLSYGMSGGIVAHPQGLTLSQPLGSQFAIVTADGASDVHFQNQRGVRTDWQGNAIIPTLAAYQANRISIDTTQLPDNVDTDNTTQIVVPSRNAVVQTSFKVKTGYRALIALTRAEGKPVPFGAIVSSADGLMNGIVDDQGIVYLSGLNEATSLDVKWGNEATQRCTAPIPAISPSASPIQSITAICS